MKITYNPEPKDDTHIHVIRDVMAVLLCIGVAFLCAPTVGTAIDKEFGIHAIKGGRK